MTPTLSRGAQTYYQTHVQSRSPLELVVMLYDGAIRFLEQAGDAMDARDMPTKATAISKAMASLEADLQRIYDHLGLEWVGLKSVNIDPGRPDYRDLYTETTRRRVAELFEPDLREYGYEF